MDCFAALAMTKMPVVPSAVVAWHAVSRRALPQRPRSVPLPQCGNPAVLATLTPVAGKPHSRFRALGCRIPGFLHWFGRWICSSARRSMTARPITPACSRRRVAAIDRVIETSIPSRLDALHWGGFHTRVVLALGITWILDGLEVTLAGALSGRAEAKSGAAFQQFRGRAFQQPLSRRRRARRARLRLAHRPDRAPKTVLHHAGALSDRDRRHGVVLESSRATRCFDSSPAPASAANTPRSIRRSRNWCRRAIAAGPIL